MDSLIESSPLAGLAPDTIAISNVNLSLGTGPARVHILKDISLLVASGEAIGLIGPSGSGKSTLLMVMAGLERPDSGEVVVNGTPFNALDEDALARFRGRQVGIVFQSFHLIPTMTALENVAVPLELAGNPGASARAAQECFGLMQREISSTSPKPKGFRKITFSPFVSIPKGTCGWGLTVAVWIV